MAQNVCIGYRTAAPDSVDCHRSVTAGQFVRRTIRALVCNVNTCRFHTPKDRTLSTKVPVEQKSWVGGAGIIVEARFALWWWATDTGWGRRGWDRCVLWLCGAVCMCMCVCQVDSTCVCGCMVQCVLCSVCSVLQWVCMCYMSVCLCEHVGMLTVHWSVLKPKVVWRCDPYDCAIV